MTALMCPTKDELGLTEPEMSFQLWLERQLDQFADEPDPDGLAGQFTEVGWEPPEGEMTVKEWLVTIARAWQLTTMLPIYLGDLLNEGQDRFGEVYAQAVESTTYAAMTLYHYSYVTRSVPRSARVPGATLSHMAVVAPLRGQPALQRRWLERAVLNRWSAKTLRKERNKVLINVTDGTVVDGATGEIIALARTATCPRCGCEFEL